MNEPSTNPVFYRLFETVDELIAFYSENKSELPQRVIGVFADINEADSVVGGHLVPKNEYESYWHRNLETVTFLMGTSNYILLRK